MNGEVSQDRESTGARTRIRDTALREFASHGFKGASLRGIADRAGVSLGMVQRQFGSKQELRAACDAHVLNVIQQIRGYITDTDTDVPSSGDSGQLVAKDPQAALAPVVPYVAMVLLGDEPAAARWFDELSGFYGGVMTSGELGVALPEDADQQAIIAVYTAMQLGVTILAKQVYRRLDTHGLDAAAAARIGRARLFLATERLVAPEVAERISTELDRLEDIGAEQSTRTGKHER